MTYNDCYLCEHCFGFNAQGWKFMGCLGGKYKGKIIGEIDECPDKEHTLVSEKKWKARFK